MMLKNSSKVSELSVSEWQDSKFELKHTLFGHSARVWNLVILEKGFVSIGEVYILLNTNLNYTYIHTYIYVYMGEYKDFV